MNSDVDAYLDRVEKWRDVLASLRAIILACGLEEAWKWRSPCYTIHGRNVIILGALKESCVLGFFKGALLKDAQGILIKPGENTRAARQIRFTGVEEIRALEPVLRAYIQEAVALEEAGRTIDFEKDREVPTPEELQRRFDDDPALEAAFSALTPGRQRAYLLHFSAAKQSTTRLARIEKMRPRILDGKGLNDCVCGLSRKLPACDGSHKELRQGQESG